MKKRKAAMETDIDRVSPEELTRAVKEKARSLGAHLVGIAPMERMENAPPDLHPKRLLPEAKSLISMAYRINRGVQQLHLRGPSPMPFSRFAGLEPKVRLDEMALDLANFLEDLDYISLPVPANQYFSQEKGMGEISHKHVAMAAGIGRLGRGGFLVTPAVWRRRAIDNGADNGPSAARSHVRRGPMPGLQPALCFHLSCKGAYEGPRPGDRHGGKRIPLRVALLLAMPVGVRRHGDGRSFLFPVGPANAKTRKRGRRENGPLRISLSGRKEVPLGQGYASRLYL